MKFVVYLLISENNKRTYIGSSDDIVRRIREHRRREVKSTKGFGNFKYHILEHTNNLTEAREREKYWKTTTGRRKLRKFFNKIVK
ncbi:GIY-YIG nuclease superfamily protein [bacterium BMS3Abin15]|nr:GIY-YIG nuclease superfamily protein [bacterium BMS3Abin15]HDH07683.1 GIY-YIG nuclease family protein [Candidatus Moranbacteria bacterium]